MDIHLLLRIINDIKFNRICQQEINQFKYCKQLPTNIDEINKCNEEKRKLFDCAAHVICPQTYLNAKLVCNSKSYKDNRCVEAIEKVKTCIKQSEIKIKNNL